MERSLSFNGSLNREPFCCTALAGRFARRLNETVPENRRIPLTETAHIAVSTHLKEGDVAIDATVGNGRDTAFLAQAVGEGGHVHGFDIQPQAIASARSYLARLGLMRRVDLYETGHERMPEVLPPALAGQVSAILFNLGYLPGGDHALTTTARNTLAALDASLEFLAPGGILSIMCYPGHPEGALEAEAVVRWADALDKARFNALWTDALPNPVHTPPRLLIVTRGC